jgi:hypothetical protein
MDVRWVKRSVSELLSAGLWERSDAPDEYKIHDYNDFHPKDPTAAERAKRYRNRIANRDGNRDADRSGAVTRSGSGSGSVTNTEGESKKGYESRPSSIDAVQAYFHLKGVNGDHYRGFWEHWNDTLHWKGSIDWHGRANTWIKKRRAEGSIPPPLFDDSPREKKPWKPIIGE